MALFLETVQSTSTKYTGLSLTECLCEGIQLTQEMMDLQEAVFRADFILHQKNQGLSESVQVLNEAGFLSSVWEKTKSIVKRVWEWIKATWNKLVAKVTEWANRIGDRLAGKTKEVKKSTIKKAELMETYATKVIDLLTSSADKVSNASDNDVIQDVKEKIKEEATTYSEDVKEAEKLEGRVTVSATFAKKVADVSKRINTAANKAISTLGKLEKTIDKEMSAIKGDDGTTSVHSKPTTGTDRQKAMYNVGTGTDAEGKGDRNDARNANAKIGFIKDATAVLKTITNITASSVSGAISGLGNSADSGIANKSSNAADKNEE
jgi:predicted house-cleaning noncanonical NTP pyrophosphatase (MazG superfamily)